MFSLRDNFKPAILSQIQQPSEFDYIENNNFDMELSPQPNYITKGNVPIRHAKTQRNIGNTQACVKITNDYIDTPSLFIVIPDEEKKSSVCENMIQNIRTLQHTLHSTKK